MTPIHQTIYNIVSQTPFDIIAVFSNPEDGVVEPVITGYPESLKATDFSEKVLKTIANDALEWIIAITHGKHTLTFQHIQFHNPNSFLLSCGSSYFLIQTQDSRSYLVSLFKHDGVIPLGEFLSNKNPIRTAIVPQWNACVLLEYVVAGMRQGEVVDGLTSIFDSFCF